MGWTMSWASVLCVWPFGFLLFETKTTAFFQKRTPKMNECPPKKGPFQKEISSSNHWLSGDMLVWNQKTYLYFNIPYPETNIPYPETNIIASKNWWLEDDRLSLKNGPFSGDMFVLRVVSFFWGEFNKGKYFFTLMEFESRRVVKDRPMVIL